MERVPLVITGVVGGIALCILALLVLVAVPFVLGYLALETIFGKWSTYVGPVGKAETAPKALAQPTVMSVIATAVVVEDNCPGGYQIQEGDTWTINGRVEGTRALCPAVEHLLKLAKARLKEGQPIAEEICCIGASHRMIFALQMVWQEILPIHVGDVRVVAQRGKWGHAT